MADEECAAKLALLRTASSAGERNQLANTWSLQLELLHKDLGEQLQLLLEADDYQFLDDLVEVASCRRKSAAFVFPRSRPGSSYQGGRHRHAGNGASGHGVC